MKHLAMALALCGFLTFSGAIRADEPPAACCKEGKCEGCSVAEAMAQLPQMTYMVGEESTCCSASAEKMAKDMGKPIHFVVGDHQFADMTEAMTQLADDTEKFVNDFATPHTCNVSGTTTLAGHKMACGESAKAVAQAMHDAMEHVQMVYKVGDETCNCPMEAKSLAEKSGAKTEYLVGDDSTSCPIDARVKMAQAKFKAAVEAFAKAQAPQEETKPVSTTSS